MEDNNLTELPFDEIDIISSKWQVQRAYRVKGGTLIEFQEKAMDIQLKYLEIARKNLDNNYSHCVAPLTILDK